MTDLNDITPDEQEDEEGKGKKGEGKSEGAGAARGNMAVSPAFFEYMASIGAPKELIAEVLRSWRHFKGEGWVRRMMDFAKGLIKSNHIQVEIAKDKDYAVVQNLMQAAKQAQPAQTLQAQQKQQPHTQTLEANLTLHPK